MVDDLVRCDNLSRQISKILRTEIHAKYQPGQRLPAITAMAKRFGVSFQTVREGLSVLAQEGLIEGRPGSGTYVCDHGQRRSAKHIAVWCERDIFDPHASYFYRYVPRQLVRFFENAGFAARLYVGQVGCAELPRSELTCAEFAHAVERHEVCGVVALDEPAGFRWLEPLRRQNIPLVGSCEINKQPDYPSMPCNTAPKGRMGAQYLLNHGRRNLALMQWLEPQLAQAPARNPVMEAFQAALAEAGVQINPKWIRSDLPPGAPGAGWEEFREIWAGSAEKPDGLLVCDDILFLGAAMAILQLGIRVPEDLLVVTHFNKGSGLTSPFPVAKLQVDPDEYVQGLGQMLVKLMRGEPAESHAATIELVQETGVRRQETEYDGGDPQITPIPRINDSGLGTLHGDGDAAGMVRRPRMAEKV